MKKEMYHLEYQRKVVCSVQEALEKAKRYCVYQERCYQEVVNKLNALGMIDIAKEEIVNKLIEGDFLNEERYAMEFVSGKFNVKKWGRIRLERTLKQKGISTYLIKKALQQIEHDYITTFYQLSEKQARVLAENDSKQKKRKKLANCLLYRGWESGLVYERVMELIP